jgi:phosphate/sulfate permease
MVRWGTASNIVVAWFLTIPATSLLGAAAFFILRPIV